LQSWHAGLRGRKFKQRRSSETNGAPVHAVAPGAIVTNEAGDVIWKPTTVLVGGVSIVITNDRRSRAADYYNLTELYRQLASVP
jgi:hypothetical protein